ncbi:AAA family ATPase [Burkholderia pyrrocinia]|nr:AAA family ATPase [Burkholderia pyrrocinia]EKS9892997.1 AAA family ATPase [Burkholderia pyrrocinia]EKS9905505.1 AAA family ATPase [Burkholderia pyrrocinia]
MIRRETRRNRAGAPVRGLVRTRRRARTGAAAASGGRTPFMRDSLSNPTEIMSLAVLPRRLGPLRKQNRLRAARRHARRLDAALRRASFYPHPAGRIERIETHLSVVYLAGRFAYKRLKPLDLGFADFRPLAARRRSCAAELVLNRPLARELYLAVMPLERTRRGCRLAGCDTRAVAAIDYLVKMRRFDQAALFSRLLAAGALTNADIDRVAARLASFHARASKDVPSAAFGSAALLHAQLDAVLASFAVGPMALPAALRDSYRHSCTALARHLDARRADGFVRACHGDLHLDNLVRRGTDVLMFDCIEFSDALRWIDVVNDLAFLVMDLCAHGRADLARRLLNRWLEATGDFAGLAALPLYVGYRALVRAQVAVLRAGSGGPRLTSAQNDDLRVAGRYIALAARVADRPPPYLLLCHGVSGSGKSVASRALADLIGAVRVSSDSERKRTHPLAPVERGALSDGAYAARAIDAQYDRLRAIAETTLRAGYPTIVDATFLAHARRARFIALAEALGVPVFILDFRAGRACMAERVKRRWLAGSDASDAGPAVLDAQWRDAEPLTPHEAAISLSFDTEVPIDRFLSAGYWRPLMAALHAERGRAAAEAAKRSCVGSLPGTVPAFPG